MSTEERIKKIEELAAVFEPLLEPHGLKHMHLMSYDPAFKDIPPQQFVEICEHYKAEPFVSSYPTAWVKVGTIEVYITSDRVEEQKPVRSTALDELKQLINPQPSHGTFEVTIPS